eukprot:CAMPEP_0113848352 /NCGR_PEP_ID=MMETSP0372-20130328/2428_1 /TAXON_ID=340204 /ORGANISM="Lankesteria abbotti" /LENGTH=160 /DNA_ID=CAMNT_0000817823 /DNA_START=107 /DNA_END=589 /DNA_ORIENTATION=+ /assembly_acc=CAM_ASM_000359
MRIRGGRGFTVEELKLAGVSASVAPTIGIAVDKRRRNRSDELLNLNVMRLKSYMSRLVVFPRKSKLRKGFGGIPDDASKDKLANLDKNMPIAKYVPITQPEAVEEARAITEADRQFNAFLELKKHRFDQKKTYKKTRIEALRKKMFENREKRRDHKAMQG